MPNGKTTEEKNPMQTGSLMNLLMDRSANPEPVIGMGATVLMWTDRHAATVIEVNEAKTRVTVQWDISDRTDGLGMTDAQSYSYEPNPDGAVETYTLRKNGRWVRQGESAHNGTRLSLGHRSTYHDYSF